MSSLPAMSKDLPIVARRLRERMEEFGDTQEILAETVGATQGAISQILTGRSQNSRLLPKIADSLAINLSWLIGVTDEKIDMFNSAGERISEDTLAAMRAGQIPVDLTRPEQLKSKSIDRKSPTKTQEPDEDSLRSVLIPQLEIGYSMGGGNAIADYQQTAMVPFPREWLRPMLKGTFADLFVARGEGDSMVPTLLDGDLVIVDTAQKNITQQDRLWCLSYGDLGMIKRVRLLPDGGAQINSDNPAVTPITAYDDEMHVIGRVIWIGRRV